MLISYHWNHGCVPNAGRLCRRRWKASTASSAISLGTQAWSAGTVLNLLSIGLSLQRVYFLRRHPQFPPLLTNDVDFGNDRPVAMAIHPFLPIETHHDYLIRLVGEIAGGGHNILRVWNRLV